jgi:hypothetical protein
MAELVKKWKLTLSDSDIHSLMQIYKADFLSKLIKEYLKSLQSNCSIRGDLLELLHQNMQPSWILPMISKNLLRNP